MLKNIVYILNNEEKKDLTGQTPDNTLIVTDSEECLRKKKSEGYAVLFVSSEKRFIQGAEYVTESLEDCDMDYFNIVFSRGRGIPLRILETERTIVREMTVEDLPELYRIYDDDEVRKYIEPLYEYEQEKEFTQNYIRNMYGMYGYGLWIVEDKTNGNIIGRIGISLRELDGRDINEIGYIVRREYRRMGIAYEVCKAIMDYAFNERKMEDLFIITEKRNLPSCCLAEKLGYKACGLSAINGCEYMIFQCKGVISLR